MYKKIAAWFMALCLVVASSAPALAEGETGDTLSGIVTEDYVTTRYNTLPADRILREQNDKTNMTEYSLPTSHAPARHLKGAHDNVTVMVRFAGEDEFADKVNVPSTQQSGENFAKTYAEIGRYFTEQSFSQMTLNNTMLPSEDTSLQLSHTRNYYEPKSAENPDGYYPYIRLIRVEDEDGDFRGYRGMYEKTCMDESSDLASHLGGTIEETDCICPHMSAKFILHDNNDLELFTTYVKDVPTDGVYYDEEGDILSCDIVSDEAMVRKNALLGEVMHYVSEQMSADVHSVYNTTICVKGGTDELPQLLSNEQGDYEYGGEDIDAVRKYLTTECDYFYTNPQWDKFASRYEAELPNLMYEKFAYYAADSMPHYTLVADEWQTDTASVPDGEDTATIPNLTYLCRAYARALGFGNAYDSGMGAWSLFDNDADTPVSMDSYQRYVIGDWMDASNLKTITKDGYYVIDALSGISDPTGKVFAYEIPNTADTDLGNERIYVEYRQSDAEGENPYDGSAWRKENAPLGGLVLYSMNTKLKNPLLYTIKGQGKKIVEDYDNLLEEEKALADQNASVLTDQPYSDAKDGEPDLLATSYGTSDTEKTENALVSRYSGKNNGIVICDVKRSTQNPNQMEFYADLTPPKVEATTYNEETKVYTITYSEPITVTDTPVTVEGDETVHAHATLSSNGREVTISLENMEDNPIRLIVPKELVRDKANRTMEEDLKAGINRITPQIDEWPQAKSLRTGYTLSQCTLVGGIATNNGEKVAGTFVWGDPDMVFKTSGHFIVKFVPDDELTYEGVSGKAYVTKYTAPTTNSGVPSTGGTHTSTGGGGGGGTSTSTSKPTTATPAVTYTITATATGGGTISPSGKTEVVAGRNQTFTMKPASGIYAVKDVKVDGKSMGARDQYIFTNVMAKHTIEVTFYNTATQTTPTQTQTQTQSTQNTNNLGKKHYHDVEGHWASDAISYVAEQGYFSGTSDEEFSPNAPMTRAMFVTVLGRVYEKQGHTIAQAATNTFTDVPSDSYYAKYVNWAASQNIVSGVSETEFDMPITREQMAAVLCRYCEQMKITLKVTDKTAFGDKDAIDEYARGAVEKVQKAEILSGDESHNFKPRDKATRAEVASMIKQFVAQYLANK